MSPELDRFHLLIRSVSGEPRSGGRLAALLDRQEPAPWPEYTAAMFEMTIELSFKRSLRQAWQEAARRSAPPRPPQVEPSVPTSLDELHASTVAEFIALLRTIRLRSGLSLPKIAERAGLPRSQAYSMLSRGNLPTKPEQVRLFVITCGLPEPQVVQVMELWTKLQ
ncbi:hypothetical protein [Lentzea sp. NPDC092896]|uniref:hypothetical protein n=1 Tax=Lentzea sp. NPDC092896 TaxID=3364127 RepID=UPI0038235CA0